MDFFKQQDDDLEYKYKILVWPNWTFQKNLNADSFTIVIQNVIRNTPKNIHWTIPTPYNVSLLNEFENVDQVNYEFPSYPNTMRCDFDTKRFLKLIDWEKKDWDAVYSHLPEHTAQISNCIANNTNLNVPIVGYCHWYEVDENTSYDKRLINQNLLGTTEMIECGVNTNWLRDLVLDKCKDTFNEKILNDLRGTIKAHYLGIDNYDLTPSSKKNAILFNHRPNEYTGWKKFLKVMDDIYKERQDFTVYGTLIEEDRPYVKKVKCPRRSDYLDFIKQMTVGIGFFQDYSAWSISTTDGLSRGIPYLVPNKLCYPEMFGKDYSLYYNNNTEFKSKLINILDDNENNEIKSAIKHINKIVPTMTWEKRIPTWFDNWNFLNTLPVLKEEPESYKKIRDFIIKNKNVSKKDILDYMGWGIRISFSIYRNRLRQESNIIFTKNRYLST